MPLDPRIADVPYASENPAQEPEPTNIIHLPSEPEPSDTPKILPGTPTLAEIREFNQINGIVDPILDLSAEDIADLAEKMPDKFNLEQSLLKYQPHWDKELIDKSAEAYNLLERRGWKPAKDLGLSKLPGMAKEAVVGGASWLASLAKGAVGVPAAMAMEKIDSLLGLPESPAAIRSRQKLQRDISETAAATEASVTGLAFLGEKAYDKIFGKKPELKTHEEKIASLKAALIPHLAQQKISEGGGIIQPSPEVQAELTQAGLPVRPEEVQKKIAGDPVGFVLFGKGLEGVSGLVGLTKATAKAAAKLPGIAPVVEKVSATVGPAAKKVVDFIPSPGEVVGGATSLAGKAINVTARGVEKAAPIGVPLVSAITGGNVLSNLGHVVSGALGGGAAGATLVKPIVLGAQLAGKIGRGISTFGKEIAGKELPTGSLTQGVRDVLQSIPDAAGHVGRGAALDLGLAAVTSTTPEDQQGLQLGTILGAAQAARGTAAWVVSGQKIAPRPWGSKTSVASSKQLPIFDAMHNAAYSKATPAVREHINAVREFLKGVGSDADVFLADPTHVRTADDGRAVNTDIEKALLDSGYDAAYAELAGKQSGFFEKQMPGKDGQQRRAIVLADADAAPHEAKHAFQDVLGEQANQVIDKVIREHYSDEWEQIGQDYAEKLLGRKLASGESWRDIVLDASGDGNIWAKRRLELDQANQFTTETGAAPREGQFPELPKLEPGQWRNVLSADEAGQAADRYLSREIAAENFDAIFKNLGASLKEKTGVLPWLARVVASTTEMLGGDSLKGRQSSLGMPLKEPVIEAIKGQARGELPEVTPRAEAPRAARPITLPSGATSPATPADREAVAAETRTIAESASNVPKAAGLRSDRELLGEIAVAQAAGDAVKLNYLSAPEEPAAAISSNRSIRRQMIEIFRNMPQAARRLWEKNFFPERVRQTKNGKIQVGGWAPEVFAANAHKTAQALSRLDPSLSPYPIDPRTKSFTEDGWKQLFEDTQKFVQNQVAGRTGSGEELVVPKSVTDEGFFKPPVEAGAGGLDQRKADFISAMFGMKLPETARMQRGKMPLNLAGQEVSAATIPGRVEPAVRSRGEYAEPFAGREVMEVNPWRAELERAANAAGVELPSVIEAFQWLNLENIKEVQHTPEQPQFRGNTLTLQAGFKPRIDNPRAIKSAAVKDENGRVWEDLFHSAAQDNAQMNGAEGPFIDGFTTNSGEFLDRNQAYERAVKLKQVSAEDEKLRGAERWGLETNQFESSRKFRPSEQKEIEAIGPDGKSYKVRFDGYYDLRSLGRGQIPAITALEDIPGSLSKFSSGMSKSLEDAGYKLVGIPEPEGSAQFKPKGSEEVRDLAEKYAESVGRSVAPAGYEKYPRETAKKLAKFYEEAKHNPDDPEVQASYDAFKQETLDQWKEIEAAGYDLEPILSVESPYRNGLEIAKDVEDNKHLFFNLSESAFGQEGQGSKQLMLEPTGITSKGKQLSYNDIFRAVHDFFGHAKEGFNLGPRGEFNAWREHSSLYSEEAQGALAAETIGQTAWTQLKPELLGPTGELLRPGEEGFVPRRDRPYAEQKNIVVPKELIAEAKGTQFKPKKGKKQDDLKFVPTSFGAASKAWILPNGKVEQLGAEWHHQWLDENPEVQKKYGLKIPAFEGTDTEGVREQAIRKGFARVNLDGATLVVEAREKDWKHIRPIVEDLIERNLDDIDKFRVQLLNDGVTRITRSFSDKLFDADSDKEKLGRVFDAFSETPQSEIGKETQFAPSRSGFGPRKFEENKLTDEELDAALGERVSLRNTIEQKQNRLTEILKNVRTPKDLKAVEKYYNIPKLKEEISKLEAQQVANDDKLAGYDVGIDVEWTKGVPEKIKESPGPKEFKEPGKISLDDFKPELRRFEAGDDTVLDVPSWVLPDGSGVEVPIGAMYHDDAVAGFLEFGGEAKDEAQNRGAMRVATFDSPRALGDYGNGHLGISVTKKPTEAQIRHIQRMLKQTTGEDEPVFTRISIDIQNEDGEIIRGQNFESFDKGKAIRYLRNLGEEPTAPKAEGIQFAPSKNPKAIKSAAIRDEKTGEVHPGVFHPQIIVDLLQKAVSDGTYREGFTDDLTDGFVTNSGEFLNREEAASRAEEIGQMTQTKGELESRDFAAGRQFKPKQSDFEDPEKLKETLSEPGWAIVTATQESQGPWNDPKNIAANKKLAADLKSMGYEYFPVSGTYKGEPQGENFVVLGISPTDAQTLGKKYGQESVLINRGLLYGDGTITPARPEDTITGPKAAEEDFYSTTPEGLDFSIPLDFNKPYQAVGEQSQLFGGREYVSPAQLSRQDLLDRYPEAIVPKNSNEKIPSDVVGSPLYKKSENPVRAFADKLVEFAKSGEGDPVAMLGRKWYSDFVPLLKKHFGKDAPMMAELLAASSPNETPTQNFFYAVDALEGFKSGRFDKTIDKFNQGFEMFKEDKWMSWYNKELKGGNIPNPPANPTPEAFLAHWIYKHNLKPKQSNGALYGFHGKAILEVMARKWLEQNKGPKVANFVQNLLGTGHGSTIDVWADRTMRRIGYEGAKDRWRILPKNGEGVSDADFEFAQKAFAEAAKQLGILPDALQGQLWFQEKKLWADNGWGRLDLGSYVNEIENLDIIRKSIKQRLKTTELKKKAVPMEQSGLDFDIEPRKLK